MKPAPDVMSSDSSALHALLADSVDYAGLFPPAGLELETALDHHAGYAGGDDAWLLGRFVHPIARLTEAAPFLARYFTDQRPLRISALGSKVDSVGQFVSSLRASLQILAGLPPAQRAVLTVEQFEAALPASMDPASELAPLLLDAAELIGAFLPGQLRVFWEIPFSDDLPETLHRVADHNAQIPPPSRGRAAPRFTADGRMIYHSPLGRPTHRQPFGVKLRTGGLDAAAFPTCGQLAGAFVAARDAGVALKFTAGLHHPLRRFDAGIGTHMHGFLNVFAAGVLAREHRLDALETQAILEDESPESFRFSATDFAWRGRSVSTAALAAHREFITSFGSCSFDEPRDDLRRFGMMA